MDADTERPKAGARRRILQRVLSLAVLPVLAVGLILLFIYRDFAAPGPLDQEAVLVIPSGAGVQDIASLLASAGVIRNEMLFPLTARLSGSHRNLKAGEYAFPAAVSPREVLERLRRGKTLVRYLTVPEGLTISQVADVLRAAPGLKGELRELPPEGSVLPATYDYGYGDTRASILARMQRAQEEVAAALWSERHPDLPLNTLEQALILASIVEKETAKPDERARVAAVFVNRLRRGMRLQSDPTVVYGLTGGNGPLGRPLTRADLREDHDHNTYARDGLPPTPICNPGKESLAAVLQPAETDELYFVADGTGGHAFARTLAEHNRNVAHWRRLRDAANARSGESAAPRP